MKNMITRNNLFIAVALRCAALLVVAGLASCGGGSGRVELAPIVSEASRAELLGQLDGLAAPDGVSAGDYADLKQALRAMLEAGPQRYAAKAPTGNANRISDLTRTLVDDGQGGQETAYEWSYRNAGDYDLNSQVNLSDLSALAVRLGSSSADPDWDTARAADGDGNGEVNLADITPIGVNLQTSVAAYRVERADGVDGPWTELGVVQFDARLQVPGGLRFNFVPAASETFVRVVPLDGNGAEGIPSNVASSLSLTAEAEPIGVSGGPQFESRAGDTLVIALPDADPTTIAVGDVVFGDDGEAGFIGRVETVEQNGAQLTVTLSPANLSDVIVNGTLDFDTTNLPVNGRQASNLPFIYGGDADLWVHTGGNIGTAFKSASIEFSPRFKTRAHLSEEFNLDSFEMAMTCDHMLVSLNAIALTFNGYNGSFPIDFADRPNHEKQLAQATYDYDLRVDGIPLPARYTITLYGGIAGSGEFLGGYNTFAELTYTNIDIRSGWAASRVGSTEAPDGWLDSSSFDLAAETQTPWISKASGQIDSFRAYVRAEVKATLFGLPIGAMDFDPYHETSFTPTTTPSPGYDYKMDAALGAALGFDASSYGSDLQIARGFFQNRQEIRSGFTRGGGSAEITGFIRDASNAPVDVMVELYESYPGTPIESMTTDDDGRYLFTNLEEGRTYTVVPFSDFHTFNPVSQDISAVANPEPRNFEAAAADSNYSISGFIMDGGVGVADVTVHFGPPGGGEFFWWPTDASGFYQTGQSFTPGITVRVTPELAGYTFEGPDGQPYYDILMDGNKFVDFTATALPTDVWLKTADFYGEGDRAHAVAVDASSNLYFVGDTDNPLTSESEGFIISTGPDGSVRWALRENSSFLGYLNYEDVATYGSAVYVLSSYPNALSLKDEMSVLKLDAADGAVVWQRSWYLDDDTYARALTVDPSGNVYAVGQIYHALTEEDIAIVKYNSSGDVQWERAYRDVGPDYADSAAFDPTGNIVILGQAGNAALDQDFAALKVSTTGSEEWATLYDADDLDNWGNGAAVGSDGTIYLCGVTLSSDSQSSLGYMLKLNSDGSPQLTQNWYVPGGTLWYNGFTNILVGSDNLLYVGGFTTNSITGFSHPTLTKFGTDFSLLTNRWLSGTTGNARLSGIAQISGASLAYTGYSKDNVGSWSIVNPSLGSFADNSTEAWGGTLETVSGTKDSPSDFISSAFPEWDAGAGISDALLGRDNGI